MGRLSGFTYREVTRRLKAFGFQFKRNAKGSHEIWWNPDNGQYTTIPNGTLRAILNQAGVESEEFLKA